MEEIPAANGFDPRSRHLWEEWVILLLHEVEQKPTAKTLRDRLTPPSNVKRYRWEDLFRCDGDNKARLFEYQKCCGTVMALFEPEDTGVISSTNHLAYALYFLGEPRKSLDLFKCLQEIKTISDEAKLVIKYGLSQSYLACVDNLKLRDNS